VGYVYSLDGADIAYYKVKNVLEFSGFPDGNEPPAWRRDEHDRSFCEASSSSRLGHGRTAGMQQAPQQPNYFAGGDHK